LVFVFINFYFKIKIINLYSPHSIFFIFKIYIYNERGMLIMIYLILCYICFFWFKPFQLHFYHRSWHYDEEFFFTSFSSFNLFDHKPINNDDNDSSLANEKWQQGSRIYKFNLLAREFTFGNALGGRKTYLWTTTFFNLKSRNRDISVCIEIGTLKIKHLCGVCNKIFSSIKALKVHMKWYFEKGSKRCIIHPPTTNHY